MTWYLATGQLLVIVTACSPSSKIVASQETRSLNRGRVDGRRATAPRNQTLVDHDRSRLRQKSMAWSEPERLDSWPDGGASRLATALQRSEEHTSELQSRFDI